MGQALQIFREIEKGIELDRRYGRIPLFIIGAGVSYHYIPLMGDIFAHINNLLIEQIKRLDASDPKQAGMQALHSMAYSLQNDDLYQSRATASNFFGILQDQRDYSEIWDTFTRQFGEGLDGRKPIWSVDSSKFHRYVAHQVVSCSPPSMCVSINYDGLTAKAIRTEAMKKHGLAEHKEKGNKPFYPCRILETADEIQDFYSRNIYISDNEDVPHSYPLIKIRGDIFNAKCVNEECRLYERKTPIYEIPAPEEETKGQQELTIDVVNGSSYQEMIKCQECHQERRIELDFPGYRSKEKEMQEVLELLYRYVVPSLSTIVVCGVSGKWDHELVDFVSYCNINRNIPIAVLDSDVQPPIKVKLSSRTLKEDSIKHVKADLESLVK